MFITIISDCTDDNARVRQQIRYSALGLAPVYYIGVNNFKNNQKTQEASGHLIDCLDASEGKRGAIIVNVAPRGNKKDGANGNPFCFFFYKETLVVSSVKGYSLALAKKLNLIKNLYLVDVKTVCDWAYSKSLIERQLPNYIANSQFRSFDFVPRLVKWLLTKQNIPSTKISLSDVSDFPNNSVWFIDNFGNRKTTLLKSELNIVNGNKVTSSLGTYNYYERLKDIPLKQTGIYTGSSGIRNLRFLEIAKQGLMKNGLRSSSGGMPG